ncbi:radical SAM family heme chaperone HemW [bacterium]|nr:radical SAM family heme chaperone HemW [bacterium]
MPSSVYIHIPFCKSKCHYCSFVSFDRLELKDKYLEALETEIKSNYDGEILKTLYFGGGTPSLLKVRDFERLIKHFNLDNNAEVTVECNPDDINEDFLANLNSLGLNRLSFGCQTFNDDILKKINRRHNSAQIFKTVKIAQSVGFDNISLDFIYGLPDQTEQMFYDDLRRGIDLGIQHISLYGLTIEDGCYFASHKPQNLPDEDKQADMYLGAVEFLTKFGFEHYEISNFSLAGYNSRHNLNYWNNNEYYGFGVAAHGYKNGVRYSNKENIQDYINNPLEPIQFHVETEQERLEEEIFLGFRRMSGIDIEFINKKYGIDFEQRYKTILKKYATFLTRTKRGYTLTSRGVLVSNTILAEFLS